MLFFEALLKSSLGKNSYPIGKVNDNKDTKTMYSTCSSVFVDFERYPVKHTS